MSLFRPTAHKYIRKLCCLGAVSLGLLGLLSAQAMAASKAPPAPSRGVVAAPAAASTEAAVCPGQAFNQPFAALGDSNYYTLVAGSQFSGGTEGWELHNGASVVGDSRPDLSTGGVLDLPSGAFAVSPPVCVTLQYPTARTYVRSVSGAGSLIVGVYYAGSRYGTAVGQPVGQLAGAANGGWQLSEPFDVKPEITGNPEGVREVRFVYANLSRGEVHAWGLFVDPRMR